VALGLLESRIHGLAAAAVEPRVLVSLQAKLLQQMAEALEAQDYFLVFLGLRFAMPLEAEVELAQVLQTMQQDQPEAAHQVLQPQGLARRESLQRKRQTLTLDPEVEAPGTPGMRMQLLVRVAQV
jgi:negative regulator of sigma E activity